MTRHRIMLVDDEQAILKALGRVLRMLPCEHEGSRFSLEVESFVSPHAALARAHEVVFDLFLVDYRMPVMDGVTLLRRVRQLQPDAARLILSGYADLNALIDAINEAGIERFIAKPWDDRELMAAIARSLAQHDQRVESRRLADQARAASGAISAEEIERRRLEAIEPGITRVNWGPDGSVILDPEFQDSE